MKNKLPSEDTPKQHRFARIVGAAIGRVKVQALAWVMAMYGVLGRTSVGSSKRSSAWAITTVFTTLIMPAILIMASIIMTGTVQSRILSAETIVSVG